MSDSNKVTVALCIEVVLMRRSGDAYYRVISKLRSLYDCEIGDCYDKPQYLKNVLKDVYENDYKSIVEEIKLELGDSINNKGIATFLETLEYKF